MTRGYEERDVKLQRDARADEPARIGAHDFRALVDARRHFRRRKQQPAMIPFVADCYRSLCGISRPGRDATA